MKIGIRAIIKKGDSIIMVEHNEKDHGGILLLPGGGVEEKENIFMATEREVMEETKLEVSAEKIMYIREVEYKGDFGIEIYVLCRYISGDLELGYDPECGDDNQILTGVREVLIEDLEDTNWKPEELVKRLAGDLTKDGSIGYLGVSKI